MTGLFFLLLVISRLLFLNPNPAFLDSREYLDLAAHPDLLFALTQGHPPIHPGYIFLLKLFHSLSVPFLLSPLAGIGTVILFYLIVKKLFDHPTARLAAVIFALLPGPWIVQENFMVESTSLFLLVLAIYLLITRRRFWATVSLTFMLLAHIQMLLWLPLIYAFTLFTRLKLQPIKVFLVAIFLAGLGYALLGVNLTSFIFSKTSEIIPWWSSLLNLARYLRNASILYFRLHTNLIALLSLPALVFFAKKSSRALIISLLALAGYLFWAQFYSADFLLRRLLPFSLFSSLALALWLKPKPSLFRWSVLIILAFTSLPVAFSYSFLNQNQVINQLHRLQNQIPVDSLYLDSHFLRTLNNFSGSTYHLGESTNQQNPLQSIKLALDRGQKVFIDSQAIIDPYQFYTGNQLHPLSLGKFGASPAQEIFREFYIKDLILIDPATRIFAYELTSLKPDSLGPAQPGQPILVYSKRLQDWLLHQRLDYFDPLTWVWVLLTNRHEPYVWVYADASGRYFLPILNNTQLYTSEVF